MENTEWIGKYYVQRPWLLSLLIALQYLQIRSTLVDSRNISINSMDL